MEEEKKQQRIGEEMKAIRAQPGMNATDHTTEMPVLPVIDMRKSKGSQRKALSEKLYDALTNSGFFYLTGIEGYDAKELHKLTTWFFGLNEDIKNSVGKKTFNPEATHVYRGYFPVQSEEISHKEGFEIGPITSPEATKNSCKIERILKETNQWPKTSSKEQDNYFKERMLFFYKILTDAGIDVMRLIAEAWNLDSNFFTQLFQPNHLSTFRLLHYPQRIGTPPALAMDGDTVLQCDEHKDSGFLTLLSTFDYEGLQIRGSAGEWVDVPKLDNCLVVNIGALLETISGGVLKATNHRVTDRGVDRFSSPYFLEPSYEANINFNLPKVDKSCPPKIKSVQDLSQDIKEYGPWVMDKMMQFAEFRDMMKCDV